MWTNLTNFRHKNEFKKYCMAKRACGKYLETILRNNLGGMQRNVTMEVCNTIYKDFLHLEYVI